MINLLGFEVFKLFGFEVFFWATFIVESCLVLALVISIDKLKKLRG